MSTFDEAHGAQPYNPQAHAIYAHESNHAKKHDDKNPKQREQQACSRSQHKRPDGTENGYGDEVGENSRHLYEQLIARFDKAPKGLYVISDFACGNPAQHTQKHELQHVGVKEWLEEIRRDDAHDKVLKRERGGLKFGTSRSNR